MIWVNFTDIGDGLSKLSMNRVLTATHSGRTTAAPVTIVDATAGATTSPISSVTVPPLSTMDPSSPTQAISRGEISIVVVTLAPECTCTREKPASDLSGQPSCFWTASADSAAGAAGSVSVRFMRTKARTTASASTAPVLVTRTLRLSLPPDAASDVVLTLWTGCSAQL